MERQTVGQALRTARRSLAGENNEDAALDAALLLEKAAGLDRTGLLLEENRLLTEMEATVFSALLEKRRAGWPTQYLLGEWEFMGLPIVTDERALIPRPDTELLVERALAGKPLLAADLGTGTGCIAVSLAYYGKTTVYAVDQSAEALTLAAQNTRKNRVEEKVILLHGDLFKPLPVEVRGSLDVVVSNPPYIPRRDLPGLMREVRDHEPALALDGGEDGLDFYRRIVPEARGWLRPGGRLCLEFGDGQAEALRAMLEACGYAAVRVERTLAGLERVIEGEYYG